MAEDKKKKKGVDWTMALPGFGAGKAIYSYLKGRRQMPEIQTGVRKVQPTQEQTRQNVAQAAKKKKSKKEKLDEEMAKREAERKARGEKKPGGIGGVVSDIEERKRRMREVMESE